MMSKKSLYGTFKNNFIKKLRLTIAAFSLGTLALYAIMGGHDNTRRIDLSSFIASAAAAELKSCNNDMSHLAPIKAAAQGFFKNFRFADEPYNAAALKFHDQAGKDISMADFSGKVLLVNLWAVWCVPCRQEMPELAALQTDEGGDDFAVVTINVDKNPDEKVLKFLKDVKADSLHLYRDPSMEIFSVVRSQGLAVGLPVTLLLDRDGCLIGSFNGSAPWGNDDAKALIRAAIAQ